MNTETHQKITATHLKRNAYLYVRQSTMRQVVENTESTQRQYALRQRAIALGWREEQVLVIDSDLGQSGASAVDREGFQKLVAEVGMGRAGIVLGLEVSRLARNSADWHRLLEICALTDTLILDEDGIYDPAHFNDRLLLGLKGTMSEAELHVLRARLRGGLLNKARRGELRCRLPIGLLYDAAGHVMLDPDKQVQETVRLLFETFARTGSLNATVKSFRQQHLLQHSARTLGFERNAGPAREGSALLQGKAVCGLCGSRMNVHYNVRKDGMIPNYVCVGRGRLFGDPLCQSILGTGIDAAVGQLLVDTVTPMALELALSVQHEITSRLEEADRLRYRQVERAQYEADAARQRYMHVDSANRLVADALEADWNLKLRALADAQQDYQQRRAADRLVVDEQERQRILALAMDFPAVWRDPNTPHRERKRMLALLIEDVTLVKQREITVAVRFRGGVTTIRTLPRPLTPQQLRATHEDVRQHIESLLNEYTDAQVARILNERGMRTGAGDAFASESIKWVRYSAKIKSLKERLLEAGWLTVEQVSAKLGLGRTSIGKLRLQGKLQARICNDHGQWLYWLSDPVPDSWSKETPNVSSTAGDAI